MKRRYSFAFIGEIRGGATPLSTDSKCFGGIRWEKLLRYYDTKAVRSNRNVGRHYYADREVYRRVSKPDLQHVILNCLRQDNTLNIGGTYHVILNLFQDLIKEIQRFFAEAHNDENVSVAHRKFLVPYCLSNLVSSKNAAFTLAEVLITLGIIGVVAAMTIPTLVNSYAKKQTVVKLKNIYSVISNASKMSEVMNGSMNTWDFSLATDSGIETFVRKYYVPYLKVEAIYNYYDFADNYNYTLTNLFGRSIEMGRVVLLLADGTIIAFNRASYGDVNNKNAYIWLYADINGLTGPNKVGRDVFVFDIRNWAKNDYYISFYKCHGCNTREQLMNANVSSDEEDNRTGMGCSKENISGYYSGFYCGALIQLDGWEIRDDYPWMP